jgi:hypothetical protein
MTWEVGLVPVAKPTRIQLQDLTLLEKRFIRTSGIYFLYRLISVADTINKK